MRRTWVTILTILWAVLIVQPVFGINNSRTSVAGCSKISPVRSSCSKSKCNQPKPAEEKKGCETGRCNPLMSCPTGNFFVPFHSSITILALAAVKQKSTLINDNRLAKRLNECWHPPELLS